MARPRGRTTKAQGEEFDRELADEDKAPAPARPGSKLEKTLKIMRSPKGATLAEMAKACEWQPQSVRGVIYNAVQGRLGLRPNMEHDDERWTVHPASSSEVKPAEFQRRADRIARRLSADLGAVEDCVSECWQVVTYYFERGHRLEVTLAGGKLTHRVHSPER